MEDLLHRRLHRRILVVDRLIQQAPGVWCPDLVQRAIRRDADVGPGPREQCGHRILLDRGHCAGIGDATQRSDQGQGLFRVLGLVEHRNQRLQRSLDTQLTRGHRRSEPNLVVRVLEEADDDRAGLGIAQLGERAQRLSPNTRVRVREGRRTQLDRAVSTRFAQDRHRVANQEAVLVDRHLFDHHASRRTHLDECLAVNSASQPVCVLREIRPNGVGHIRTDRAANRIILGPLLLVTFTPDVPGQPTQNGG